MSLLTTDEGARMMLWWSQEEFWENQFRCRTPRVCQFSSSQNCNCCCCCHGKCSFYIYTQLSFGVGSKVTLLIQLPPTSPVTPLPLWGDHTVNTVFRETQRWTDDNTIQANTNCRIIEPWSNYDSSDAVWHWTLEPRISILFVLFCV